MHHGLTRSRPNWPDWSRTWWAPSVLPARDMRDCPKWRRSETPRWTGCTRRGEISLRDGFLKPGSMFKRYSSELPGRSKWERWTANHPTNWTTGDTRTKACMSLPSVGLRFRVVSPWKAWPSATSCATRWCTTPYFRWVVGLDIATAMQMSAASSWQRRPSTGMPTSRRPLMSSVTNSIAWREQAPAQSTLDWRFVRTPNHWSWQPGTRCAPGRRSITPFPSPASWSRQHVCVPMP